MATSSSKLLPLLSGDEFPSADLMSDPGPEAVNNAGGRAQPAAGKPSTAPEANSVPISKPSGQSNKGPARDGRPSTTSSATASTNSAGFGLLAPAEREAIDTVNGVFRDGRVRDPVPSKLKGKTDGRKGNFSVIHMDVTGRGEATERDAQAKRTSESTALAAKKAFENGYVSLRRTRFVHVPDDTEPTPPLPAPQHAQPMRPSQPPQAPPPPSRLNRAQPLDPVQTKAEQARLLTLLRSLHPVLVVDQICKALAFFGGIPGAPPPVDDGSFPQSAEANGSGRLFVGWIAEIFPNLDNEGQRLLTPLRELEVPESMKRKRGRPKGSKATKVRKDKGIKKGPLKTRHSTAAQSQSAAAMVADDSWVDVADDGEESEMEGQDVAMFQQPLNAGQAPRLAPPSQRPGASTTATPLTTAPFPGANPSSKAEATPKGKRRGRPKGSKNRPKEPASSEMPNATSQTSQPSQPSQASQVSQASQPLPATQAPATQAIPMSPSNQNNQSFTAVNSGSNPTVNSASETPTKRKAGRPKGSKNKPRPSDTAVGVGSEPQPAVNGVQPVAGAPSPDIPLLGGQPSRSQTYQAPAALALPTGTGATPNQANNLTATAQKRKRKTVKNTEETRLVNDNATSSVVSQAASITLPNSGTASRLDQSGADTTASIAPPPAKRQRKGKEPKSTATGEVQKQASRAAAAAPEPVALSPPAQQGLSQPVAHDSLSVSVDQNMSLQSPQLSHFEVQSPTMENYEAQLQAQLEQQAEPEPQVIPTPNRVDARHLMANRLQQQQRKQQQRQRPQQQSQQSQHSQSSASQSRSPIPQQQTTKPQASGPMATQQPSRASQTTYSQYRQTNSQYGQQRQSYSPQHQQQFSTQQHSPQLSAQTSSQNQQYPAATQQQQQQQNNQQTDSLHPPAPHQQQQQSQQQQQQHGPAAPRRRASLESLVPACNAVGTFQRFGERDIAFACDYCDGFIVWEDVAAMPATRRPLLPGDAQPNWQAAASRASSESEEGEGGEEKKTIVFAPVAIANHMGPPRGHWLARLTCPYCDQYTYVDQGYDGEEELRYAQDEAGFPDLRAFQEHLEWHHTSLSVPLSVPALAATASKCTIM